MRFNISNNTFTEEYDNKFTLEHIHFICIALILIFSAILSTIIHRNILYEYE